MDLSWMAWTTPTALFFISISLALIIMIIWSIKAPQAPRVGVLRIATTPGDRLFVSLLGSAFICLAWLGFYGTPMLGGLLICFFYGVAVFRWV
ncbi:MAG: putative small integral membrane protein [Paraglaciecola psychrophila]|jgi:predicted small integral membrane protein